MVLEAEREPEGSRATSGKGGCHDGGKSKDSTHLIQGSQGPSLGVTTLLSNIRRVRFMGQSKCCEH